MLERCRSEVVSEPPEPGGRFAGGGGFVKVESGAPPTTHSTRAARKPPAPVPPHVRSIALPSHAKASEAREYGRGAARAAHRIEECRPRGAPSVFSRTMPPFRVRARGFTGWNRRAGRMAPRPVARDGPCGEAARTAKRSRTVHPHLRRPAGPERRTGHDGDRRGRPTLDGRVSRAGPTYRAPTRFTGQAAARVHAADGTSNLPQGPGTSPHPPGTGPPPPDPRPNQAPFVGSGGSMG